ncbi:hypothetical protein EMCRGX_G023333 [Ephydatia muelleri]
MHVVLEMKIKVLHKEIVLQLMHFPLVTMRVLPRMLLLLLFWQALILLLRMAMCLKVIQIVIQEANQKTVHHPVIAPIKMTVLKLVALIVIALYWRIVQFLKKEIPFVSKHQAALTLLSTINDLSSVDPQVALVLLRLFSSFCKLAHIARATPPHLIFSSMEKFDADVHHSFADYTGIDVPDSAWRQAQLSLTRGGFGLHSLALHPSAAYIASLCGSDDVISTPHLENAITHCTTCVPLSDSLSISSCTPTQKKLSDAIEEMQFNYLLNSCSLADKARLLSVSSPHASAWISIVPSLSLGLHLDPNEFQTAVKWWLGVNPH